MLEVLIDEWFSKEREYNEFIRAMLNGEAKKMEKMLNILSASMFSTFDTGTKPSRKEPERFYHGFVLGLLVDLKESYVVDSNRESGYGRYDIMIKPNENKDIGVIIEFKVFDEYEEKELKDTIKNALQQIEDKKIRADIKR